MKYLARIVALMTALAAAAAPVVVAAGSPRPSASFADSTVEQQFPQAKSYDVHHTRLELKVDMDRNHLAGTATHTLSALREGMTSVPFHQSGLSFRGVTLAGGRELDWYVDGDSLWVKLPEPLRRGETISLTIDYEAHDRPQGTFWITPDDDNPQRRPQLWTHGETHENRFWFPGYDAPNDLRTSEMLITAADEYTVVANGHLESVEPAGSDRKWHFKMDVPHVNYLQTLIVGKFNRFEENVNGVPIESYYDPMFEVDAERAFGRTDDMMRVFNEKTGVSYPYPVYRQATVDEYLYGGMEHVTATTLTERTIRDANAYELSNSDALLAHELAHQWFGDYVTCEHWSDIWLNEGFATYMETVFYEEGYSLERAQLDVITNQARSVSTDRRYLRPMVTRYYEDDGDMFDGISYGKGGCVLHMLRYELGDDLFWESVARYLKDNGPGNVVTEDLREAAFAVSGRPLTRFFEQWVYMGGHPKVAVSWKWVPENSMVEVTVKQTQKVSDLVPLFEFPVELDFTGPEWHQNHKVRIDGDKHTFFFQALDRPTMVEFDRESWILKDLTFKKPVPELITQLETSPAMPSRHWAAEQLGDKNEEASVRALARCLINPAEFYGVREQAAESLGKIGSDMALDALKDGLSAEDARVRRAIAEALGKFESEASLAVLRSLVTGDPSNGVVARAVRSAGQIDMDGSLSVIKAGLARDRDWRQAVRRSALQALQDLKDPANLDLVYPYIVPGTYHETRAEALETLGRLGAELDEEDDATRKHLRRTLEKALHSSSIHAQEGAADGLRYLGDREAIRELERMANADVHLDVAHTCRRTAERLRTTPDQDDSRQRAVLERLEELEKKNRSLQEEVEELRGKVTHPAEGER